MAYVKNGFIGESGRLIADIIEITDIVNKKGFLVTMDIGLFIRSYFCHFCIEKIWFWQQFCLWD